MHVPMDQSLNYVDSDIKAGLEMKDIIRLSRYVIKKIVLTVLQSTSNSHDICGPNGIRIEFTSIVFLAANLEENTLLNFRDPDRICQCMDLCGESESSVDTRDLVTFDILASICVIIMRVLQ